MLKKSRIPMVVASALFAAQAGIASGNGFGQTDTLSWSDDAVASEQLTVFNPDGSSYAIVPIALELATPDPIALIAADESVPDQLTVFEPNGLIYSYEFVSTDDVAMLEPMDLFLMDEDVALSPVALNDEDAMSRPTYVAYYVSPPTYTGILEEATS